MAQQFTANSLRNMDFAGIAIAASQFAGQFSIRYFSTVLAKPV
jgi:hypothetical protein